MEIKWHDQSRGAVKNERWVSIPSGKAMEMLRRKFPDKYGDLVRELNLGREVRTDTYTLRDETVNKAQYMQGLDDDDFHTVTFFLNDTANPPPVEPPGLALCQFAEYFEKLFGSEVDEPSKPVEGPMMTATEVQMRIDEYLKLGSRLNVD